MQAHAAGDQKFIAWLAQQQALPTRLSERRDNSSRSRKMTTTVSRRSDILEKARVGHPHTPRARHPLLSGWIAVSAAAHTHNATCQTHATTLAMPPPST